MLKTPDEWYEKPMSKYKVKKLAKFRETLRMAAGVLVERGQGVRMYKNNAKALKSRQRL